MTSEEQLNILIVDDHQMLLEGLRNFITQQFPNAQVLLASKQKEIVNILQQRSIDVMLLDLMLGGEDSRNFLGQIQQISPESKIIVVSSLEEQSIVAALLQNGAHGFVGKSSPTMYIAEAVTEVLKGKNYIDPILKEHFKQNKSHLDNETIVLSQREKDVLFEILKEKKSQDIADTLFISKKTVEYHRSSLFMKFDVNSVTGLVKKAIMLGFLPDDSNT